MLRCRWYSGLAAILACSGAICGFSRGLCARDEAHESVQAERWRAHYAETASKLQLREDSGDGRDLALLPEPLHAYSNPSGGSSSHGALFVWTADKRPQVIGAVWSRKIGELRRVSVSLHSLAPGALRAGRDGATFWNPPDSGIEFSPWREAGRPAISEAGRLTQMRNMVRSLEAVTTSQDQSSRLRVLPQPLYRYRNRDVVDGAVFCWFKEWDPEIFAIVEARAVPGDPMWYVGFARFSNKALSVRKDSQELWSYDPEGTEPPLGGPDHPYISVVVEERLHLLGEDE